MMSNENCVEHTIEGDICKITLRNRKKEIVGYTIIDREGYEDVVKYRWFLKKRGYVWANINKKQISLSHFIKGKPTEKCVIDHINNDKLDNRKSNLKNATQGQNSQNKKKTNKETSSQFIGVSKKKNNKWEVSCGNIYLGRYNTEKEAGEIYDKYVLLKYGKDASTNNLIKYKDVIHLTLEDILSKKNIKDLPRNIQKIKGHFSVCITYNKKKFTKITNTLEKAKIALEELRKEVEEVKQKELKEHFNKDILRDENNFAIIPVYNKKKKFVNNLIIDDDKWHQLSLYKWCFINNYIIGTINGKNVRIHRYLMNAPDDKKVDHINSNTLDNRILNLRLASDGENCYNSTKIENTSSKYKGVSKRTGFNNYIVSIQKDGKYYNLGLYYNEDIAGLAYNLKASELFGDFAKLNKINIDDETYEKYKEIIYKEWNKEKKEYRGLNTKGNKYEVRIKKDNKLYVVGRYDTEIIAALAYNLKSIELNGDEAILNKIDLDEKTYNKYKKIIIDKWNIKKEKKYFGITYAKDRNKYRAKITFNNKIIYIGSYNTELEAVIAYNEKATELLGDKAKLNKIDDEDY
jgi:hypothetical protein